MAYAVMARSSGVDGVGVAPVTLPMLPRGVDGVDYLGGHVAARHPGVMAARTRRRRRPRRVPGAAAFTRGKERGTDQAAEPAFHWAQSMFQPLRPLSGLMVLSGEFFTMTTSPMSELS